MHLSFVKQLMCVHCAYLYIEKLANNYVIIYHTLGLDICLCC